MILQEVFSKRYGAIRSNHLLKPRIFNIAKFEFPKNSIFNYVDNDGVRVGPDVNDYFFRDISKKIFVGHQLELLATEGNPVRKGIPLHPLVRKFHVENKRFRMAINLANEPNDANTLAVMNYCLIEKGYRYPRSIYANYYKWKNLQTTIWKTMASLAQKTPRDQYYIMRLPQVLPSLARLRVASDRFNQTIMRQFNTKEALFFLEFWKWLSENNRKDSIISNVPDKALNRINIVIVDSGHWCLFNLGTLNSWRYIDGQSDQQQRVKIAPIDMQKRFLRAMMFMLAGRNMDIEEPEEEQDNDQNYDDEPNDIHSTDPEQAREIDDNASEVDEVEETTVEPGVIVNDDTGKANYQLTKKQSRELDKAGTLVAINEPDEYSSNKTYQRYLANLDKDLAQLDIIDGDKTVQNTATVDDQEDEVIADNELAVQIKTKAEAEREKTKTLRVLDKASSDDISTFVDPKDFVKEIASGDVIKEALVTTLNKRADAGLMDGAEYRRKLKLIDSYKLIPSPAPGVPLSDFIKYDVKDLKINESDSDATLSDVAALLDKSMLKSTLKEYDKKYITEFLDKDIANVAMSTQKAGFMVTDYEVEKQEDVTGRYEVHTMRVTPIVGKASTLRFKLPSVDEDGSYTSGGVKYHLRKQRIDTCIRKISPSRVALTTYYGKTFVIRSEKKSDDYSIWLHNQISALSLEDRPTVTNVYPSNVFDYSFKAPRVYSQLGKYLKSFSYQGYELNFDNKDREIIFTEDNLKKYEVNGSVLIGFRADNAMLLMDKDSSIYEIVDGSVEPKGSFEEFMGINTTNAPVEYTEARIFGKNIPIGVILAYKMGLTALIEKLKIEVRRVGAGQRQNLQSWEFAVNFEDETLIFSKDDAVAAMVIAGFLPFSKTTKRYSVYAFDKPAVYMKLLEQYNMGSRYLKEIDLLDEMFVDPISEQVLAQDGYPTSYRELIVEATKMLATEYHNSPLDLQEMRIRGYERFAGAVYTEVVNAIRDFRYSSNTSQKQIDLNPYAVWRRVTQDPAAMPSDSLNPIQNLKEVESVTYSGAGGRSSRAMVKASRAYHENDIGVISEATVDSHEVAINTYLSANPKFNSVRGTADISKADSIDAASLVSTSALLSVGGDQDSAQRLNMVSIQQSHTIACNEYKAPPVRTGYEYVLPKRVGPEFARTADEDGRVVSVDHDAIVIEYKSGKRDYFQVGKVFSKSKNLTIPHYLKGNVRVDDKVKKGDVITYNTNFFEKDSFDPKAVIWKNSVLARVVLMESRQTHEDASSISVNLARKLTTRVTKVKDIVVNFNQEVRDLVKVGSEVDYDTKLCIIEDAVSASAGLFDKSSLDTLRNLSAQVPVANVEGIVEKIEVFYNGEIEDMSNTLSEITTASDRELKRSMIKRGKKPLTGQVGDAYRINNQPLDMDSLVIRVYITGSVPAGIGDKGVFANQLKTIFSEVMDYEIRSESGLVVDAVFGAQSVFNRIVNSVFVIGTTNTLLGVIGKKAAALYESLK